MKSLAAVYLLTMSACFIPTQWRHDSDSTRKTGILIQSYGGRLSGKALKQ